MPETDKTLILICQNIDCKSRGSPEILAEFERAFGDDAGVEVKVYMCFGTCNFGPNLVVYPQRQWYSGIKREDVPEIIQAIRDGTRVERICDKIDEGMRDFVYQLIESGIY